MNFTPAVVVALMTLTLTHAGAQEIASTFDTSPEGWTCVSDNTLVRTPEHVDTGGDPGGHIRQDDFGAGSWFFLAPPAYLGDLSGFVGGTLSFSLRSVGSSAPSVENDDIIIESSQGRLVFDVPPSGNPGPAWQRYEVGLDSSESWQYTGPLDGLTLDEQVAAVLTDVSALLIRGDWRVGPDTGSLDTVHLAAGPPCPADFNGDDNVNVLDVVSFISNWNTQGPGSDFNGDGSVNMLDVVAFIQTWNSGCP